MAPLSGISPQAEICRRVAEHSEGSVRVSVVSRLAAFLQSERQRFGLLLLAIAIVFALQGIAEPGRWGQVIAAIMLGATLLLALWVAELQPRLMRAALVLILAVIALSVVQAVNGVVDGAATRLANALLVMLAPPAIVVGVLRNLRARQAVTVQAVLGVLCVYLLLGMFFAYVYGSIDNLGGSPFFAGGEPATVARCLYYSFTTMTTVGYGDLTARSNLGHTLSVSEALLGQIYLVTVVSLIVGNVSRGSRRPPSASS